MNAAPNILIACVGNIFLGDDAFGTEMAGRLAQRALPTGVKVVDFGIRGYDLALALTQGYELVILVDAVPRGEAPGTLYVIEPEMPNAADASASFFDAHRLDPVQVLKLAEALGGNVSRLLIVGCEPAPFDPDAIDLPTGLSPAVSAALDGAVEMVESLINKELQPV